MSECSALIEWKLFKTHKLHNDMFVFTNLHSLVAHVYAKYGTRSTGL